MSTLQELFPNLIPEAPFHSYSEQEITSIWKDAVFTPDANVLLRLYELSDTASDELKSKLKELACSERLVITHQAVKEFMTLRVKVIMEQATMYRKTADSIQSYHDTLLEKQLHVGKLKQLVPEHLVQSARGSIKELYQNLHNRAVGAEMRIDIDKDPIVRFINSELHACIQPVLDETVLAKARDEAKRRKKEEIPPGSKDKKDGDFIIWTSVLKFAKEKPANVIIITEEKKDDWWSGTDCIHPRLEMIKEFEQHTKHKCHLSSIETFLLKRGASPDVIDEIVSSSNSSIDPDKPIHFMTLHEKDNISRRHQHILRSNDAIRTKLDLYRSSGEAENSFNVGKIVEEALMSIHRTVQHLTRRTYIDTDAQHIHLERGQILRERLLRFRDQASNGVSHVILKSIAADVSNWFENVEHYLQHEMISLGWERDL